MEAAFCGRKEGNRMEILKKQNGQALEIALAGRLDTTTAPQLEAELKNSVTEEIHALVFDFAKLEYISSCTAHALMFHPCSDIAQQDLPVYGQRS